ncbi:MAG: helix-turn-helix transcriptional regulator [Alphaproteobacteria bacterium]|nr:helix-turn-helix transcriptional regulator [Alphaproteobacteria bacterium]
MRPRFTQGEKNLELLPDHIHQTLSEHQALCVFTYSSHTKLKAVIQWRYRMKITGVTQWKISDDLKIGQSRISQWLNFVFEPSDPLFKKIEDFLKQSEDAIK